MFVAHERFADEVGRGRDGDRLPGRGPLRRRRPRRLPPLRRAGRRASPTTLPDDRTAGAVMNYTSGTTGQPKGVQAPARRPRPRHLRRAVLRASRRCSASSRWTTASTSSARRCTTPPCCMFTGNALHLGPHRRAHGQVDARGDAPAHRAPPGHPQPHGADPVPPAARPARRGEGPLRRLVAAPHGPRRRALPARDQAPDDRVVGPGRSDEYYAATEGGGTIGQPRASGWRSPARSARPGRPPRSRSSTTTATSCAPGEIGTVYMQHGRPGLRVQGRPEKTEANRMRRVLHRRRHRLPRRGRLPVPVRPQDRHDHLRRGQHLSRRDRGRAAHPPQGRRRGRLRHPARRLGRGGQGRRRARRRRRGRRSAGRRDPRLLPVRAGQVTSARRSIDFIAEMPRDPNGKLYKRKLRDPYWEGQERAI